MNIQTLLLSTLLPLFSVINCAADSPPPNLKFPHSQVKTGIDVLQLGGFEILEGKRVGLVTNPTGVNRHLQSTVDILYESPDVDLVALFGPEHGVRGNFSAGDHVGDQLDEKTGIPVYSLYGKNRKPDSAALAGVDVIVYDIQDIGVRSYTYISTMGLVMEAAARFGKDVIILDRPNPLGGNRIEGPGVSDGFTSFISQYNIPYVYGLTCGELAIMLNEEGMLEGGVKCHLKVVQMEGWHRGMTFGETGLVWIPPSPHIPTAETALYYASTGIIGEIDPNLIGIGYTLPFQTLATEHIDAEQLAGAMNGLRLEGVKFRPIYFKPYYKSKSGKELQGVHIHYTRPMEVRLTEVQFHFLAEARRIDPGFDIFRDMDHRYRMFDLGCGTDEIRNAFMDHGDIAAILERWRVGEDAFRKRAEKYYLYK